MPAILIVAGVFVILRITDDKSLVRYGFTDEKKEIQIEVKPEFYRTLTTAEAKVGDVEKQ